MLSEKLTRLRQAEMITLSASVWFRTIILSVMSALPSVVSVVTLGTYAYMGNELTPAKVFTAISLFGYLKHPLVTYPTLFNAISDGYKSLNSISDFLSAPELETYLTLDNNPQIAAKISNTTFSWSADKSKLYRIRNTTHTSDQLHVGELVLKTGSLTIIIGPVGSGKSMLLSALLGQLHVSNGASGFVTRHPSVSYAPQSTWLPQDSIRNTVLFGNTQAHIDWRRYRAVIRACHLVDDLDHLEYGDCTEIGLYLKL